MKNSIIIALLLMIMVNFVNGQKQIVFKHLGLTDKTINTVEIYLSQTDMDSSSFEVFLTNQYFLHESLFDSLYYHIKQQKFTPLDTSEMRTFFDWGMYHISLKYKTEFYKISISRKNAVLFFEGLLSIIPDNPPNSYNLYENIEGSILKRIKHKHSKHYENNNLIDEWLEND